MKTVLTFIGLILAGVIQAQPALKIIEKYSDYETLPKEQRLVRLSQYVPNLHTDIVYATSENFTHQKLYNYVEILVVPPMAKALQQANQLLRHQGIGLLVYDAYRPYSITQKMWEIVPDSRYAANPKNGSDHNRGSAIDISLYDLKTGKPLEMPTTFDNFTEKAHLSYQQLSPKQLKNREILQSTMKKVGLKPLSTEWWHFSLHDSKKYPLLNIPFSAWKH